MSSIIITKYAPSSLSATRNSIRIVTPANYDSTGALLSESLHKIIDCSGLKLISQFTVHFSYFLEQVMKGAHSAGGIPGAFSEAFVNN